MTVLVIGDAISYRGANAAFELTGSARAELEETSARWLHICGHALLSGRQRESALSLCDAAVARGIPVSLDLCPPLLRVWREETLSLVPRLTVLFSNEPEMRLTCPGLSDVEALASLVALVPRESGMVALKRGALGCTIAHSGGRLDAPPFHVDAIDTNGCGDAFVAGFLRASLRGAPLAERAHLANALGALVATRRGAADSLPTQDEVERFLENRGRNGGVALLGIALASGAQFIRVCMLTGAGVWDAGTWDEGCAADLMRRRKELGAEHIKLFADVDKKHSVRFPGIDLQTHIEWTRFFGADALIVSGRMTGDAPNIEKVREAKALSGDRPLLIGSGADERNIAAFLGVADGVIVGSSIKAGGLCENPVDVDRVRRLVKAARG